LLSTGKNLLAAFTVLGMTLFSSFRVMPLQIGLGPLYESEVVDKINSISDDQDSWLVVGGIYYEHIPLLANNDLVGGVQLYPDKDYWISRFGPESEYIFNRKAHINFISSPNAEEISLPQGNLIIINVKNCDSKILDDTDYILSDSQLSLALPCLSLIDTYQNSKTNLYLYKNTLPIN